MSAESAGTPETLSTARFVCASNDTLITASRHPARGRRIFTADDEIMSWSKTPTKSETTKKQKYVVPQITNKWGRTEYILTPEPKKERKPRVEHENADAI